MFSFQIIADKKNLDSNLFRTLMIIVTIGILVTSCTSNGDSESWKQPLNPEDWPHYARDLGSTKYSPLEQIHHDNVDQLEIVWKWESADYDLLEEYPDLEINNNFQTTPIKIDDKIYTTTSMGQALALNPSTGEVLWTYNPYLLGDRTPTGRTNRGLSYWKDGTDERILLGSGEYLIALDAQTGKLVQDFGTEGRVHLAQDIDDRVTRDRWASVPLVVRDVVIVGSQALAETRNWQRSPPGYVRGFDVRTGKLKWRFNPIPQAGEPGNDTWADSSWAYTGHGNVWTLMTGDAETGTVFLPLKTTTNDWYGGHRKGDNLYGESLVALNSETGEIRWHYQTVHHGLWDYDLPAAPNLVNVHIDGQEIKAVAQVTKQAFIFFFNRETGEPIWPIEERPVLPSDVPGEQAAVTQPFPTWPTPFDLQGITKEDLIDFTPELRNEAIEILSDFVYGPMYTPPTVRDENLTGRMGTVMMPGWVGGANWGGGAIDPETGMIYIPSVTSPNVVALEPPDPEISDFNFVRGLPREVSMPQGLPILKPPYGRITAIDCNTGNHIWMQPNGPGPIDHPLLKDMDLPWLGQRGRPAPLLTKTLLFLGEGSEGALSILPIAGGPTFRAWDKKTGEVIWEVELEAGTSGAPMTYMINGKQHLLVAIGDHEVRGQYVVFALP